MRWVQAGVARLRLEVDAQRGHLFCWVPVCLGIGIGLFFALPAEPSRSDWALLAAGVLVLGVAIRWVGPVWSPLLMALILVACGTGLAALRSEIVAAPVLGFRYYGPVEGRIVAIDRSASDAVRLTLDQVVLARMSPARIPDRVRISLHGTQDYVTPVPGMRIMTTGHLSPPSGPVEPGGYDFQRDAWFKRIGAVGYTRIPILLAGPPEQGSFGIWINGLRLAISSGVQERIPGEAGAFAAAIMTGDRSAMGQETLDALRQSNLAHLLAISGLHMGILAGFVFAILRYGLALWPAFALRLPVKRVAAGVALATGAFYLAMSGGNVATERAFIMAAVVLVAVMLGRRAITLRSVALAAVIVLILRPEALMGPGFQMSFAATTALVAVFAELRTMPKWRLPRRLRPVLAVFTSSLVAGLATAPFAAAHFNLFSHYGLIANLTSVPLMGILVMPAAVLATCLAPFGLEMIGFKPMEWGLRWILTVAHRVSAWSGAVSHVIAPPSSVLPLMTLGSLVLVIWQGQARWLGALPMLCACIFWLNATRPDLLIAESGGLIGVMTAEGRALSKATGDGFSADSWLEDDGAPVSRDIAFARPAFQSDGRIVRTRLGETTVMLVTGNVARETLVGCGGADILILSTEDQIERPCIVHDLNSLRDTGAIAGYDEDGTIRFVSARDATGWRRWHEAQRPR